MKKFLLLLVFLSFSTSAQAEYCEKIGEVCVEGQATRKIDGFEVTKPCWKYETQYKCYKDEHNDYCPAIAATPGCELIKHICTKRGDDGECDVLEYTYKCGNLVEETADKVVFLDTEYTVTRDELDTRMCDEHILNQHCALAKMQCEEGPQTRIINGYPVHKECWKYKRKYMCMTGSRVSDCDQYENKCVYTDEDRIKGIRPENCQNEMNCVLTYEDCLSKSLDGKQCYHKTKRFTCFKISGKIPEIKNCGINYCLWGDCEKKEIKENPNMGKGIAYLSLLARLKDDFDHKNCNPSDPKSCKVDVFKGDGLKCEKHIASGITKNCCKEGKTFLEEMKIFGCEPEEERLAKAKDKNLCHHVGDYCSSEIPILGVCLTKKQSYCCFQSKLSRILQQQGRAQLGIGWGSAESPECHALSLEDIKRIDFSKMDLREIQADITASMLKNLPMHDNMDKTADAKLQKAKEALKEKGYQYTTQSDMDKTRMRQGKEYMEEVERRIKGHYTSGKKDEE